MGIIFLSNFYTELSIVSVKAYIHASACMRQLVCIIQDNACMGATYKRTLPPSAKNADRSIEFLAYMLWCVMSQLVWRFGAVYRHAFQYTGTFATSHPVAIFQGGYAPLQFNSGYGAFWCRIIDQSLYPFLALGTCQYARPSTQWLTETWS